MIAMRRVMKMMTTMMMIMEMKSTFNVHAFCLISICGPKRCQRGSIFMISYPSSQTNEHIIVLDVFYNTFVCFLVSICDLPSEPGPCFHQIYKAASKAQRHNRTSSCIRYLDDMLQSCTAFNGSFTIEQCNKICGM